MKVEQRAIGDVTILDVEGRMTVDAPRETRVVVETVRSLLKGGRRHIVLNLDRVSQMDSSGLCDVVTAYTAITSQGGALKLLRPGRRVRELMAITKLLSIIDVYDAEADAVASFRTS